MRKKIVFEEWLVKSKSTENTCGHFINNTINQLLRETMSRKEIILVPSKSFLKYEYIFYSRMLIDLFIK